MYNIRHCLAHPSSDLFQELFASLRPGEAGLGPTSMANLALTYWNQGRWTEAEKMEVRVMGTRRRVLGEKASRYTN
jgi:hypothetical protein